MNTYRNRALLLLKKVRSLRKESKEERNLRIKVEKDNNNLRIALETALVEIKNTYCSTPDVQRIPEIVIKIRNIAEGKKV